MPNPYQALNVGINADDETIRQAYLAAVRRFPPDRSPQEFQRISEAYGRIKTEDDRLALLLFEPGQGETIDDLLAEERCRTSRRRIGLSSLLSLLNEDL
ncbi:MAG: J domain-containing protein [Planctomycetes bacterium]|nr:J domain-containing protein [Planctomycetota bacterium]